MRDDDLYQDWDEYHDLYEDLPTEYEAHYVTQINRSGNWDNNKFGIFQPRMILQLRNIPSRMKTQGRFTVVLRYATHGGLSKFQFLIPPLFLLHYYCGPSNGNKCAVEVREVGGGHVATSIYMAFTLSHKRTFRSTHRGASLVDIRHSPSGNTERLNLEQQQGVTV